MHKAPPQLAELVRRTVEALGYEHWGLELLSRPRAGHLLRVYIDSADGIGLADCEKVSHQLSGVLDVEDPIRGEYVLEVSSPGMDRPLFEKEQFERFKGQLARVKLSVALEGRSNFKGTISGVEGDRIVMLVDGEPVRLPFSQIAAARLVPQF